ncbi:Phage recombination protein Bet [Pararobbsia alpina]|uniref:phage recombination protein Bet n=1 Tax=Pararobbsia alpina TaxID=621374 RepID=UPI0039A69F8A
MSNAVTTQRQSLVAKFADKFGVEANKMLDTLKATAFKQSNNNEVTNEQMAALLIVADQYGLNPFTKEIYAFPDKGGIVPVIGVDGWARIVNEHAQCDGFEFKYAEETTSFEGKEVPEWMEIYVYRKDRQRPVIVREYFAEVVRANMQPWKSHPNRMLRHKTFVQGARLAFGFAGVFDEDEGERILERDMGAAQEVTKPVPQPQSRSARSSALAIEQADADGVIEQPVHRQREAVQQTAEPAQRSTRRAPARQQQQRDAFEEAAAGSREPGSDDEDQPEPLSDSQLRVLKTKLENAALGEADMRNRFGFGYDGATKANYHEIVAWTEDPAGA